MEIRILQADYLKSDQLYNDFLVNRITEDEAHFTEEVIELKDAPDFPIYINTHLDDLRANLFVEAMQTIESSYLKLSRDIQMDASFWQSLLLTKKRQYILNTYPEVETSASKFRNVIMKKFDWENYIYKCLLGAQYVSDNIKELEEKERYYRLMANNLDVYNYIIKYEIFRNDQFVLNVLDIIDELDLSDDLKKKVQGREDLGEDERIGRRVIFELNKSYPVVLSPTLDKEELKLLFMEFYAMYAEGSIDLLELWS